MVDDRSPPVTVHARTSTGWRMPPSPEGSDLTGGAIPAVWLGAPAPGGLMLPPAEPTPSQLYAPRGVWLDDRHLIACDTGNHRVLIWNDPLGGTSHAAADVVLGQPNFTSEGAQAGGRGPSGGMRLPTGVLVHEGRLVVADAWNHRLLVWDAVPERSDAPPDHVVGQPDDEAVEENRGSDCGPRGFYWPFGIAMIDGHLWVADTGNRRVLAWADIPRPDEHPGVVLGQPDAGSRDENRGQLDADSFRWPHDLAGTSDVVFVADAGNHRVLGWRPPPAVDEPASQVMGQPDFTTAGELPYADQSAATLRFPYAVDLVPAGADEHVQRGRLAVADTANNRVLVWDGVPDGSRAPADRVLGQHDFAGHGENRWDTVGDDTLCWPYGLSLHDDHLAVADSGNNRIMIWTVPWP